MMFPANVPPGAEKLDLIQFIHTRRKPSRLAPPAEQLFAEFECPACHAVEPLPMAGEPSPCNCGLTRLLDFGSLYIWRTAKVIHVNAA